MPSAGCNTHKALQPDKPFYMYWASGAIHGPHHIMKEWADKYKGKFDDGWDAYRERVFKRAKEKGWIPADAQLTPRHETMPSWESIPEDEKPFQRRLMEVAAGYAEHVDVQVGRLVDRNRQARLRGQHADLLHLGRQRFVVGGSKRHHQRAARTKRDSEHRQATYRGARRTRRTRRARLTQDRQPVSRRLGLGRQHALQGNQASGLALRRHT